MKKFFIIIVIILISFDIKMLNLPIHADSTGPTVFINEFMPDPLGADAGHEWVELYNNSVNSVDLNNWKISTKSTSSGTVRSTVITNSIIKPMSYFIISEFDASGMDFLDVGSGKLNMYNSNAEIYLTDSLGNKVDDLVYTTVQEGKSLERRGPVNSDYCNTLQIGNSSSLGLDNSSKDMNCWPVVSAPNPVSNPVDPISEPVEGSPVTQPVDPISSPIQNPPDSYPQQPIDSNPPPVQNYGAQSSVIISEAYPSPNSKLNETEWLEIYNQDIYPVDLIGMYLKERAGDGSIGTTKTMLPASTLDSGSYLVIQQKDLKLSLNNSGDEIYLFDVNDTIVDKFKYDSANTSLSVSRKFEDNSYIKIYNSNDDLNYVPQSSIPTPGSMNQFPMPKLYNISELKTLTLPSLVETFGTMNSQIDLVDGSSFYIQDGSSAIKVYLNFDYSGLLINLNDSLDITGNLKFDSDEVPYLEVESQDDLLNQSQQSSVSVLDLDNVDNLKDNIGDLVEINSVIYKNYGTTFYFQLDSQILKVKIVENSGITLPDKTIGDNFWVEGVLIYDGENFIIIPRSSSEIKIFPASEISAANSTTKNTNPSTPSAGKILGASNVLNLNQQTENQLNAGDSIYSLNSPADQSGKVYIWPVYLTSSTAALLEIIRTFTKIVRRV